MFMILVLATTLVQATPSATLPATPQGRQIEAFVKALRSGEAAFVKYQEDNMLPKRTPEQLKTMHGRIRKEFGDFKILNVLSATADAITVAVAHPEGLKATFTFSFEKAAPFRITNMFVEVS